MASVAPASSVSASYAAASPDQSVGKGSADGRSAPTPEQLKKEKQLHGLGFDRSITQLVYTHPDFVDDMLESGVLRKLVSFRNSMPSGPQNHEIKLAADGAPCFKVNGQWTSWTDLTVNGFIPAGTHEKRKLKYDLDKDRFLTTHVEVDGKWEPWAEKHPTIEGWNYISPGGLVAKERFEFDELYPVEQLTPAEYQKLRQHADTYFETNPETDRGIAKDCIFQVVTAKPNDWLTVPLPGGWYGKNLRENAPRHVGLRVINPKGEVYSFGFQIHPNDSEYLLKGMPWRALATVRGKFSTPDYEDSRRCNEKTVTSVPVTSKRAEEILKFVGEQNRSGSRFNFLRQNCGRAGAAVIEVAGIPIDTRISVGEFFGMVLPDLADVPYIGKPLDWLIKAVKTVVNGVFQVISQIAPPVVIKAAIGIKDMIFAFIGKIQTIATNALVSILGGTKMGSPLPDGVEDEPAKSSGFSWFSRVIREPMDYFKESTCTLFHSSAVVAWQKKQRSTLNYTGSSKLNFCLLPDSEGVEVSAATAGSGGGGGGGTDETYPRVPSEERKAGG